MEWYGTRFKAKGGDTYVMRNLTNAQVQKIIEDGIPTLSSLIEGGQEILDVAEDDRPMHSGYEFILDYQVVTDDGYECEEWETAWTIAYSRKHEAWTANRFVKADEWWALDQKTGLPFEGYYEGFVMAPGGGRVEGSYQQHYVVQQVAS
jgi:hypothetical protein|tara:strand:- start:252 stop:698 length:447 start_codon:yes stop_codon:yes gene_type:complete